MTNEELAARIQGGESELIPTLWEQVERFIMSKARARAVNLDGFGGVTEEDLYQSGFFALLYAINSFDPQTGFTFITYLVRPLQSAFADAAGYRTGKKKSDPLQKYVSLHITERNGGEGDGVMLADVLVDPVAEEPFAAVENGQLRGALEKAVEQLPETQKRAVVARYFLGRSLSREELKAEKEALKALRHPRIRKELKVFC